MVLMWLCRGFCEEDLSLTDLLDLSRRAGTGLFFYEHYWRAIQSVLDFRSLVLN